MGVEIQMVPVVIETSRHHICGLVAVPAVSRLSDYANDPLRRFWAVTDAEISGLQGSERSRRVEFLLVAAHEITMISPIKGDIPHSPREAEPADFEPIVDDPLANMLSYKPVEKGS